MNTYGVLIVMPYTVPSVEVVSYTYHQWFRSFRKYRRYCQLLAPGRDMQRFLQFRLGSHNLPVVAGQLCGIATARVCTYCGGIVADKSHMVHECPVLQPLKGNNMLLSLLTGHFLFNGITCKFSGLF